MRTEQEIRDEILRLEFFRNAIRAEVARRIATGKINALKWVLGEETDRLSLQETGMAQGTKDRNRGKSQC